MKKSKAILVIDLAAFIAFVFLTSTGILLRYLLPERSGHWQTILGLNKHEWGSVHYWIAVILFILLALHLLQHKKYILNLFRVRGNKTKANLFNSRALLGLLGLIVIIILALLPLFAPIERSTSHPGSKHRSTEQTIQH